MFTAWCEGQGLTLEALRQVHVRRFLDDAATRNNPYTGASISTYTLHGYAQVLKGFLNWCAKDDDMQELVNPKALKIEMPRVDFKVIGIFSDGHIARLYAACKREHLPKLVVRDEAIIAVLLHTGIRASELLGLTLDNVHIDRARGYIKVFGKLSIPSTGRLPLKPPG